MTTDDLCARLQQHADDWRDTTSNVVQLCDEAVARIRELEQENQKYRCPIGFTNGDLLCSAGCCPECLAHRLSVANDRAEEAERRLGRLRAITDAQAKDWGLWFVSKTAPEAYSQAALRTIHHAIEGTREATVKKVGSTAKYVAVGDEVFPAGPPVAKSEKP